MSLVLQGLKALFWVITPSVAAADVEVVMHKMVLETMLHASSVKNYIGSASPLT